MKQRRPRQSEEAAKLHNHAYAYCIKVERDGAAVTVPVCFPALLSVFASPSPELRGSVHLFPKLVSYKINCAKHISYLVSENNSVPGFGEQLVHGLACFIDHNICVSRRTEHFYTITTIMHS